MNEEQNKELDTGADIVTLVDEDGLEHEFEIIDTSEIDGMNYVALIPIPKSAEEVLDDSGELVILRVVNEDGEEFLDAIEDEAEFDKVSDIFVKRLEDVYDFED